jgi:uncharacterized protein YndB with AHSA1/START domain
MAEATGCEIELSDELYAPRALVYEALTNPVLLKRWYGPKGWTLADYELDLRVGGAWCFLMRSSTKDLIVRGIYREIVPDKVLVSTESFDAVPGEYLTTITLASRENDTAFAKRLRYPTQQERDAAFAAGKETGETESLAKLADLIAHGDIYGW